MKRFRYRVSATDLRQAVAWVVAATHEGLSVPRFLAKAGDIYARHLANIQLRRETSAFRRAEKAFKERNR